MNENAQNAILDQLRAIPQGKKVRFLLRDPAGKVFPHVSAIDLTRQYFPDGFDTQVGEVALASVINPYPPCVNPYWASYAKTPRLGVCSIVGIEPLAPELPDLETLQKWVAEGVTVRIEYTPPGATVDLIGSSPVTCKLLEVTKGNLGRLNVRVPSPKGPWNMHLDAADVFKGSDYLPLVTSITPVTVAQTPEEIDTIMQRAAKSGAQVEAITEAGVTHIGDVLDAGDDCMRYRVPAHADSAHKIWWLHSHAWEHDPDGCRRIVSVRELAAEKQTKAEMLTLLQIAHHEGYHVEATMCDGSKLTGAVTRLETCKPYHTIPSGLIRVSIGGKGASFGANFDSERIAAIKLLPREEKRPDSLEVKVDGSSAEGIVTFTLGGSLGALVGLESGLPYSLASGNPVITPTCCADVAPYIGRRIRVEDGIEGILTGCGIDPDDDENWFALDGETPNDHCDKLYSWAAPVADWSFELLPDEPTSARPCQLVDREFVAPKVPADLEPYIGRHVRVLAGEEREVAREGILTAASDCDVTYLAIDDGPGWYYGSSGDRSTLVEVLPELQDAEPDDCDDDDLEDEANESVPSDFLHRVFEAHRPEIVPQVIEGKLTLAGLLAMAPPPSEVRAYEAFQVTVQQAMVTGVIRG